MDTINGQGDRIGHSTYHSMQVKFSHRYSSGLTVQASYVLSKLLTDADSGSGTPEDQYNRRLEKSIASYDQTHVVKLNYVYELPFGKGKRFLSGKSVRFRHPWRLARSPEFRTTPAVRPSVSEPPSASPSSTEEIVLP